MSTTTRRVARATLYGGVAASVALLFACSLRSDTVTGPGTPNATRTASANGAPHRMYDSSTYFEFQVEQQVRPAPGNPSPRYPDALRAAGTTGEVLVQFVVDTTGGADMLTFKILKWRDDMFTAAVRS